MDDVKRYDQEYSQYYDLVEKDDGPLVQYTDYSKLKDKYNAILEVLKFYAEEDQQDVNWGVLESVYDRPATKALEMNDAVVGT